MSRKRVALYMPLPVLLYLISYSLDRCLWSEKTNNSGTSSRPTSSLSLARLTHCLPSHRPKTLQPHCHNSGHKLAVYYGLQAQDIYPPLHELLPKMSTYQKDNLTRPLYLLVFPTRASTINGTRSHWAIFIPYTSNASIGKLIQVLGTPFTGYGLEFKRNYNLSTITEKFDKVLLGEVDEKWVEAEDDQAGDGKAGTDVDPRDEIEKVAKGIEVPGVSREPLNPLVVCIRRSNVRCRKLTESRAGDVKSGRENLSGSWLAKES